jgi:hypothetical protein
MTTKKKLYFNIISLILLFAMLVGATYAILIALVDVKDNFFETGYVKIELNGGKLVFDGSDFNLAPSSSITKPMTVKNLSSVPIHYRVYLENVSGSLSEAISFNIYNGSELVKTIEIADFDSKNALVSDESLIVNGEKTYSIEAFFNESAGTTYQNATVTFDFVAEAVQAPYNPNKEF